MINDSNYKYVISNLGWVDKGNLWIYSLEKNDVENFKLSDSQYLSIHKGENDYFSVGHYFNDTRFDITVHHFSDPTKIVCKLSFDNFKNTVDGDINLLNHIGKLYKNPEKLLKGLQNDWFCSTFFFPIYGDYQKNEIIELDYSFAEKTNFKTELSLTEEKTENGKTKISLCIDSSNEENSENKGHFLLNSDRSIHEIKLDFGFSDIQENINIFIQETKEISERKTKTNVVFDEKEEQEKLRKSKSLFIEEIDHKDILPKHR